MAWQRGPEYGGIGCIAVHPSHSTFVVGERARSGSRLLVYDWPSRELQFTLPWSPHDNSIINNNNDNDDKDKDGNSKNEQNVKKKQEQS